MFPLHICGVSSFTELFQDPAAGLTAACFVPCRGFSVPADCGAAAHPGDAVCPEVQPAIHRYSQQKLTLNLNELDPCS